MSKKSLWDFYDGEPFMENPHLAIVGANPKRSRSTKRSHKKGSKMAAKRRSTRRRGRKASPRRRTAKRNFPSAGLVFNPRRRKSHKRRAKRNPVMRHSRCRHSSKRNPALLGVTLPPITMIAWGAGGFIGPPMVEGFVNKFLPAEITASTLGRYAVKIGSVLGLTWLVKTIMGQREAFPVALGGSMYVVVSAINEFAPQLTSPQSLPPTGTSAYRTGMIKAYRNGMISTGVGAYSDGMGRSLPSLAGAMPGLAQPSTQMGPYNLLLTGMTNPTFADPRFAGNAQIPR